MTSSLLEYIKLNNTQQHTTPHLQHHIDEKTLLPTYFKSKSKDDDYLFQVLRNVLGDTFIIKAPHRLKDVAAPRAAASSSKKIKNQYMKNMLNTYPFNLFNFKTREECKSSARSKPYYIKKSDMLNIINETPELKKIFPAKYKQLPKEDLCDIVFDNGRVV